MIIDIYTHTFPDKIAAPAIAKMQQACHAQAFSSGTRDGLKASMQAAGIDRSVVLPVATNPLKISSINDLSIALTEQEGLIYFGCIHPDAENWYEELGRIAAAGIKGIKIHPVYQGADIDDPRFLRILARAAELNLLVVMHAGDDIGFPGVVRCSPKMIRNALRQVEGVKLIAAHMGGWKNWEVVAEKLVDTDVMLDTAFSLGKVVPLEEGYYTEEQLWLLRDEPFCELVRAFGSKRVLFGTDSPWSDQRQSRLDIEHLPLSEEEKADILGENACRLLYEFSKNG
ncbi:MAG: amidohydrolase family protein [Clostridia bacterium]|nr:amidohydrolase family protein [Clostridia bacterium]